MSLTVATIQTSLNTYLGDASIQRITAAQRLDAITEATVWLQESLKNDHQNSTYSFSFYDTLNYYKITSTVADFLESVDVRRQQDDQIIAWASKSPREIAVDIAQDSTEESFAIERKDKDCFLVINHEAKVGAKLVSGFDSTSDGGGTWAADATNSDAANVTIDNVTFVQGSGSLSFDITVAQSGNNRATIQNSTLSAINLTTFNSIAGWMLRFYPTDVSHFSSVTLYWGSDASNYWSATVTTDSNGSTIVANTWNRLLFTWPNATKTGTPDVTAINFIRVDVNYTAAQTNATAFRIDDLEIAVPETLTFFYTSWNVGTQTDGTTAVTQFGATTDIPYFSGRYDQYKYAVAHKAAAILFNNPLRQDAAAQKEENLAIAAMVRAAKIVPSSVINTTKSFRAQGTRFRRIIGNGGRR